jgi:hypothetical protein
MSSLCRDLSATKQGNEFFINIVAVIPGTHTFNASGAAVAVTGLEGSQAAGALILRDMGKTVRVPANSNGNSTSQRILRKVQRFDGNAATTASWPVTNGFVGFNEGVGGANSDNVAGFETFYIEVSGVGAPKFARLGF